MAVKNFKQEILETDKIGHHKIASLHRDMSDAEFNALKLDIEMNGQIEPVKVYRNLIIDGRHRQRALSELGIHDIKAHRIPRNYSMDQLKELVMGTETRRADSVAQKAIRGYLWYIENADSATQQAAATKFSVSRPDISNAKKLYDLIGKTKVMKLYTQGYIFFGDKRYTTLQSILKAISTDKEEQKEREPIGDEAEAIKDILQDMLLKGDIAGIAYVEAIAKKFRMKDV